MKHFLGSLAAAGLILTAAPVVAHKSGSTKTTATSVKPASKPRTAASLQCSKEADAKGLHGKARKTFRHQCKTQHR